MALSMDLQEGLVGHWTMDSDDVDNGKIRDSSAYNNHGTINGASTEIIGVFDFDGSDDTITTGSKIINPNNTFTVSCWFYPRGGRGGVAKHDGGGDYFYFGLGSPTEFGFVLTDGNTVYSTPGHTYSSEWTHYVGVSDRNTDTMYLYVNGSLQGQKDISSIGTVPNADLAIGRRGPGNNYDGKLDDIRVYNRALSEDEINELYNQRSERKAFTGKSNPKRIPPRASGGNETIKTIDGVEYKIHEFTSDGTLSVRQLEDVDVLVVGGGGGGGQGGGAAAAGGGGGGGGVVFEQVEVSAKNYSISVGSGGDGASNSDGNDGGDSSAFGLTALGGGGGGTTSGSNGHDGGCGGGGGGQGGIGGNSLQAGSSSGGFGNDGGDGNPNTLGGGGDDAGGGGGGAGQKGFPGEGDAVGGDGGSGINFSEDFGTSYGENGFFAGGGGGGQSQNNNGTAAGSGGKGGGGKGELDVADDAVAGPPNTGGGGGGGANTQGADGGSGIVLIRYET